MAMSFEQLLERLRTSGVSNNTLNELATQSADAITNSLQADTATASETKDYFDKVTKALENYRKDLSDTIDVDQELLDSYEEEMDILRDIMDNELESTNVNVERLRAAQERYKELTKLRKAKKQFLEGMDKGEAAAEQLLQATIGLSTEWNNLANLQGAGGLAKGFAMGSLKMLHPMNILMSIAQKVFERAVAYDKASSSLFKKTGIDKSQINLKEMATELKGMGIDLEQKVASSVADLQDGFRSIGQLGTDQLKTTAKTITVLEAFGANSKDTVATFGILTKTLGKTPEQANEFLNNTTALAGELARPPSELLSDFVKAAPVLARFGNQSERVFKDISLQATLLEMDVAQLVGLSEGMDTFEGAAKAAQAFNIAVGQPFLSAQALLSAEPAQKLQLIADAYSQAGKVPLKARMRRGLAAEMGVNPAELERILKLNSSELGTKRDEMDVAQASMADNITKAAENQTFMDKITAKMQQTIDNIIKVTDLDVGLGKAADLLTKLSQMFMSDKDKEYAESLKIKKRLDSQGGAVRNRAGDIVSREELQMEEKHRLAANAGLEKLATKNISNRTSNQAKMKRNKDKLINAGLSETDAVNFANRGYFDEDGRDIDAKKRVGKQSETERLLSMVGFDTSTMGIPSALQKSMNLDKEVIVPNGSAYKQQIQTKEDAMATPMSVGSNYVQPVFNKQDKFYAAKDGGAIANALDEVLTAVDKLIEEKRDVNLDISERKLAQAVDGAFAAIQRRTV
jgi:ABC-type transporter Mla subunit MlaD